MTTISNSINALETAMAEAFKIGEQVAHFSGSLAAQARDFSKLPVRQ